MKLSRALLGTTVAFAALVGSYGCSSDSGSDSSGSGGASGTTSNTTTTSTGSGMGSCADMYTSVPKGDCDLIAQDCGDGQACAVVDDGGAVSKCIPAGAGQKDKGEPCATNAECKGGLSCLADHCAPFCCPGTNEPCGEGKCDVNVNFDNDATMFAYACSYSPTCDLFAGNCADGAECHLSDASACLSVCDKPSGADAAEGDPCKYRNDCGDSQVCNTNMPDDGICRFFCNTGNSGAEAGKGGCPMGRKCVPVSTGCDGLGICLPS